MAQFADWFFLEIFIKKCLRILGIGTNSLFEIGNLGVLGEDDLLDEIVVFIKEKRVSIEILSNKNAWNK